MAPKPKRLVALGRLLICPCALKLTVRLKSLNCVWFQTLNISHRNCRTTFSAPSAKFPPFWMKFSPRPRAGDEVHSFTFPAMSSTPNGLTSRGCVPTGAGECLRLQGRRFQ